MPPREFAFMAEMAAALRLYNRLSVEPGAPFEREMLVRRAGVFDRLAESEDYEPPDAAEQHLDAMTYARELLDHDRAQGTTCGMLPAADPRWDDDPRGYARQEHAAWAIRYWRDDHGSAASPSR